MRRHVADEMADRVFLIADSDDDGKLGLAMNALRQAGGLAVDNIAAGGVPHDTPNDYGILDIGFDLEPRSALRGGTAMCVSGYTPVAFE